MPPRNGGNINKSTALEFKVSWVILRRKPVVPYNWSLSAKLMLLLVQRFAIGLVIRPYKTISLETIISPMASEWIRYLGIIIFYVDFTCITWYFLRIYDCSRISDIRQENKSGFNNETLFAGKWFRNWRVLVRCLMNCSTHQQRISVISQCDELVSRKRVSNQQT